MDGFVLSEETNPYFSSGENTRREGWQQELSSSKRSWKGEYLLKAGTAGVSTFFFAGGVLFSRNVSLYFAFRRPFLVGSSFDDDADIASIVSFVCVSITVSMYSSRLTLLYNLLPTPAPHRHFILTATSR